MYGNTLKEFPSGQGMASNREITTDLPPVNHTRLSLDALGKSSMEVEELVGALIEKLSPILSKDSENPCEATVDRAPCTVDLANTIGERVECLSRSAYNLRRLLRSIHI